MDCRRVSSNLHDVPKKPMEYIANSRNSPIRYLNYFDREKVINDGLISVSEVVKELAPSISNKNSCANKEQLQRRLFDDQRAQPKIDIPERPRGFKDIVKTP